MASTPLLGLSLPADGTTNWGTLVNTSITALLDSAIAGTTTLTTDADITLSSTTEATNEARQAIILWKPPSGTATRTITAPAKSKTYVVINATGGTQSIIFRGIDPITGPTTGVTIPAGKVYMLAWNGTDFVIAGGVYGQATVSVDGLIKLGDATVQSVAANAVTATASRTYALQVNSSGQGVVNVPWTDTTYSLPAATDTVLGGIKLGDATQQTTAASAVSTTASRTYALQVNASGQGVINVPWTDTVYSLPTATNSVLGGIKLGDATQQTTAANTVTATASRTYAVQLTSGGNAVVNVPWTDTVYTLPSATDTVLGGIKLGDATQQTTAANTVTTTASRTYALQVNASGQGLVNVPWTDTTYTLPTATATVLGGIKLGDATVQTTAANAVTATASRTYALQVNASGQGLVNVPWTDTTYTLPTATDSVLGGIKLGDATVQSVAANAVTATASRTYAVQLTSTGNAVVNVPWTSGGGGTVTSVGATSPVASSGGTAPTISLSANYGDTQNPYASKTANNFLAAPNGSAGAPTFRAIVADDIPTLNQNTTGSAGSATNIAGGAANRIPYNTGAGATSFITAPTTATTFLTWNGSAFIWSNVAPSGSTFATDISVNTLTVGKGPNNPTGTTTFGYQAGAAATTNNVQQTALGYRALATATTTAGVGFDYEGSTAVGYKALENSAPSILSYNTAVGAGALKALTTGGLNTAVGAGAARSLVGLQTVSTAIGALAGEYSTTGGFTAVGARALNNSTNASYGSVAVGVDALRYATTNSGNSSIYNQNNTAIGHTALSFLDADTSGLSGNNNTALGYQAGYDLESGSNNTILGYDAQASSINVSNEITLGNSAVTTLRCQVTSITSLSDQRDKYDIEDLPVGLNLINALRPRRYKWDKRDWYIDEVQTTQEDGTVIREKVAVPKDGSRAQTDWNEGFVAQEAKAALQSLGVDWFPLVYDVNPEKLEMSSGKLIPVLVKAIQELTARIEALEAK